MCSQDGPPEIKCRHYPAIGIASAPHNAQPGSRIPHPQTWQRCGTTQPILGNDRCNLVIGSIGLLKWSVTDPRLARWQRQAKTSQGRTGQDRPGQGRRRRRSASWPKLGVDLDRHTCPCADWRLNSLANAANTGAFDGLKKKKR